MHDQNLAASACHDAGRDKVFGRFEAGAVRVHGREHSQRPIQGGERRVPVRGGVLHFSNGEGAACTGLRVHDHRLRQFLLQGVSQLSHLEIEHTARAAGADEADRPAGDCLGLRGQVGKNKQRTHEKTHHLIDSNPIGFTKRSSNAVSRSSSK